MSFSDNPNGQAKVVRITNAESFSSLLEKLGEEHYRKVNQLKAEIADLRAGLPGDHSQAPSVISTYSAKQVMVPPADDPIPREHASLSSIRTSCIRTPTFCDNEIEEDTSSSERDMPRETISPARVSMQTDAKVHQIWQANHLFFQSWSTRFEKIIRVHSSTPRKASAASSTITERLPLSYYLLCGCLPLQPSSKFKMCWDLTALLALCYDIVFIPMQVFDIPDGEFSVMGIIDRACVFFWTLDLPLNFLVGFYTKDGGVETSLLSIARRYVKHWFFLDLVIIGIDWLTLSMKWAGNEDATGSGAGLARLGKIIRVARSLRTLRLLRLMKLRELLTYLYEVIDSEWVSLIVGTLINLLTLVSVNHAIACLWFLVGTSESPSTTWVDYYGFVNTTWEDQYVASMHWSLAQFTAASSAVIATNPGERFFSVIVLLFAIVAFSSFLSGITSAMTRLRTINSYHVTQTMLLNKFLKQSKISRDLSARVTRYVQLVNVEHESWIDASRVNYLSLLSGPLNVELQWERFMRVLKPHPFFRECSYLCQSTAMHHLCFTGLSSSCLARQDVLFDWGVKCEKMYFPISGFLFYRRAAGFQNTPRYAALGRTSWFCENALWTPWMHHGIMKALIEVTMVMLNVAKFHDTALAYPEIFKLGVPAAAAFVVTMNTPTPRRPYTWDVPWELIYPEHASEVGNPFEDIHGKLHHEVVDAFHREAELVDFEYRSLEGRISEASHLPDEEDEGDDDEDNEDT